VVENSTIHFLMVDEVVFSPECIVVVVVIIVCL